jgi:hypothetical protein
MYEEDTLFASEKWEFLAKVDVDNQTDFDTLKALFSSIHFKSPRQDKWIRENDEDGPTEVDSVFIGKDGWCLSYCESESGAVKFSNNRFNVNAVGKLSNSIPKGINRLSRDAFNWLSERVEEAKHSKQPIEWHLQRYPRHRPNR